MYWRSILIDERAAGRRVDVYLAARFSSFSRTLIASYIRQGKVLCDDRPLKPSSILAAGSMLRILIPGIAPETPPPPLPPVLYEDERIIALSKPAGLLVHPAGEKFAWGLIGLVKRARPDHRIDLVHRLDRETSGVMVLTKDLEANAFLKRTFVERKVRKIYRAIARGVIPWDEQVIDAPIGAALDSQIGLRRGINPDGQTAKTTITVIERMAGHTLVACRIHTGRTHQIRVHMEHAGFPLLGDKIYGQPDEPFLRWLDLDGNPDEALRQTLRFSRHALHAWSLTFPDPASGQYRTITAPLPDDMQAIVDGADPSWEDEEDQSVDPAGEN